MSRLIMPMSDYFQMVANLIEVDPMAADPTEAGWKAGAGMSGALSTAPVGLLNRAPVRIVQRVFAGL